MMEYPSEITHMIHTEIRRILESRNQLDSFDTPDFTSVSYDWTGCYIYPRYQSITVREPYFFLGFDHETRCWYIQLGTTNWEKRGEIKEIVEPEMKGEEEEVESPWIDYIYGWFIQKVTNPESDIALVMSVAEKTVNFIIKVDSVLRGRYSIEQKYQTLQLNLDSD
ncbi:MAG: hypothetical protein ACFFCO_12055 [Promethearchaeota archaeon]